MTNLQKRELTFKLNQWKYGKIKIEVIFSYIILISKVNILDVQNKECEDKCR